MEPANQPQQMGMRQCWRPPSPFSVVFGDRHIRLVTKVRELGVPLDTTFTPSVHCREAGNTARQLFRRSFLDLSNVAFVPLHWAIASPHLAYAMEAKYPKLRADIIQRERVLCLEARLVRGLRHVPYEERLRKLNLVPLERRRRPKPVCTPTDFCKNLAAFDEGVVYFLCVP